MKKVLVSLFVLLLSGCATTMGYLAEDLGYVSEHAQIRADEVDDPETNLYAAIVAGVGALAVLADRRWYHRSSKTKC